MGGAVFGFAFVSGGAFDFEVVLHEYTVVEDGDGGGFDDLAIFEDGAVEDDVVGLPFAGFASGVDEWWVLAVDGTGLSVGVGAVVV